MKRLFGVVILFLISCTSIAGVPFPFSEQGWNSSEKKTIDDGYLQLSDIVIGTTTLDEVIAIFGKSTIYRPDKRNYSPNLLCYKSDVDDTSVIFQSGPLGGWTVITAIWIGKANLIGEIRCTKSKFVDRKKMAVNGLSLSLSAADIENIIGRPTFRDSTFFAYRYVEQTTLKNRVLDISSGLEFEFNRYKLDWFRIYKQLSN